MEAPKVHLKIHFWERWYGAFETASAFLSQQNTHLARFLWCIIYDGSCKCDWRRV